MNGLMTNDEHLLQLLKNQTTVVKKSMNILEKKNDNELKRQEQRITNFTNQIGKTMDLYATYSFFSNALTHLSQEISDFGLQIETLLQVLFDCRKHHLNHNLFTTKQLMMELKSISEHMGNGYLVPEGRDMFNLITVVPHIMHGQILFNVSIPLMRTTNFKIFRFYVF